MMEKRNKHVVVYVFFALIVVLLFKNRAYSAVDNIEFTHMDFIDYSEDITTFNNPERGFYRPIMYHLDTYNNHPLEIGYGKDDYNRSRINPAYNFVHLRVDISQFSGKYNNYGDLRLTPDALDALDKTLQALKANNVTVIIRFAYDAYFAGDQNNYNKEPELDMIKEHIEQLGPVLLANKDVIANIEVGLFGPWGEQHSSTLGSPTNIAATVDSFLDATKESMKISVRRPDIYATWRGIDRGQLNTDITQKGTRAYQVGMYNDGYLGSLNDLGTFANREIEVEWLSHQAAHTFYGGELVMNVDSSKLDTVEYMEKEAFKTHTSYLNIEWDYRVINPFKEQPYVGADTAYQNATNFQYLENHLGYRFVLRDSALTSTVEEGDQLHIKFNVENVGFANLIKDKKVSVVLENEHDIYELGTQIDPTTWNSKSTATEEIAIDLPDTIQLGDYNVYLRVSEYGNLANDNNFHCIRFANKDVYNQNIGANLIGKFTVKEKEEIVSPGGDDKDPDGEGGGDKDPDGNGGDDKDPDGNGGDDKDPDGNGGDDKDPDGNGGDDKDPDGNGGDDKDPDGNGGDDKDPDGNGGDDKDPDGNGGDDNKDPDKPPVVGGDDDKDPDKPPVSGGNDKNPDVSTPNGGNTQKPSNSGSSNNQKPSNSNGGNTWKPLKPSSSTSSSTNTNKTTPSSNSEKQFFDYTIEYYYDGILDNTKNIRLQGKKGDIIDRYTDKVKDGYVLEKVINMPLTILEDASKNVMKVYYVKKTEDDSEKELSFPLMKEEKEKASINLYIFGIIALITFGLFILIAKKLFKKEHKGESN